MARASGQLTRSLAALTIGVQQSIKRRAEASVSESAGETYQQIQVPLAGNAAQKIAFADVPVVWRLPFLYAPQQRQAPFAVPHFSYGIEFTGTPPSEAVVIHASVLSWTVDARNWLIGAVVRFTAQAPDAGVLDSVAYNAAAHLTFQGYAAQTEDNGIVQTDPITPVHVTGQRQFHDYFTSDDLATAYEATTGTLSVDTSRSPVDGRLVVGVGGGTLTPDVWWQGGSLAVDLTGMVRADTPVVQVEAPGVFTVTYTWNDADLNWDVHVNGSAHGARGGSVDGGGITCGLLVEIDWFNGTTAQVAVHSTDASSVLVPPAHVADRPVLTVPKGYGRSVVVTTTDPVTITGPWRDDFVRVEGGGSTPDYRTAWSNSIFAPTGGGTDGLLTSTAMPMGTPEESDSYQPDVTDDGYTTVVAGLLLDSLTPLNAHGQCQLYAKVRTENDLSAHGFEVVATVFLGGNVYTSLIGVPLLGSDGLTVDPSAIHIGTYVLGVMVLDDSTGDWTESHVVLTGVPTLPCWLTLRCDNNLWAAELWNKQNPFSGHTPDFSVTLPSADPTRKFSADDISGDPVAGYRNLETSGSEVGPTIELGQVRWSFEPSAVIA